MKKGTCYHDVYKFIMDQSDSIAVHGSVYSPTFDRHIDHAWIETDTGYIWEPQTNKFYTKEEISLYQPIEHHRYTFDQVLAECVRTEHSGPWKPEQIDLNATIPNAPFTKPFPPFMSPRYFSMREDVPRYAYHVPDGKVAFGKKIKAYKIRETEAADQFRKGYKDFKYVWLSLAPVYKHTDAYIIDLTRLENNRMRFTGQVEGHLLHRGDISPDAVIGIRKAFGEIVYRDR